MCLVVVGWKQLPEIPLIVAGNRDEFHARPTEVAHWWPDRPDILGGRDLQAGGTWLALHRSGRFATVTNFRDAKHTQAKLRSRGHLVTDFLDANTPALDYLHSVRGEQYAGFNLLVCDGETLAWLSNRGGGPKVLEPGIYGQSNALLDTPWHKVVRAKAALRTLVREDRVNESVLFRLLGDREKAPVKEVRNEERDFEMAHAISAPFIVLPEYGTRSSSVLMRKSNGSWRLNEHQFDAAGQRTGEATFSVSSNRRSIANG